MKKLIKIFSLFMVSTLIFVGCSSKNDTKPENVSKENKTEASEKIDFGGKTMNVVATSEKYKELFDKFGEKTNSKVEFLSMSSGEVISRIKAEGGKPMADLWFGGGIDAFIAAKNDGLLEQYSPKDIDKIKPEYRDKDGYWMSKGLTVVGFLANNSVLKEKNLQVPQSWEELAKPEYKGEVIMSNPAISGTNYGAVKGILDQKGTEEGWKYWEKLNENIPFYGKRGKDPQEKTSAGEFAIGIIPVDKSSFDLAEKNDLTVVYPKDGIPWVPEGVAIFKNGDATDIAKAFEDFMLTDEAQQMIAELDGKDGAQLIVEGIKGFELGLPQKELIKEDLSTFGSQRDEILNKWKEMVGNK